MSSVCGAHVIRTSVIFHYSVSHSVGYQHFAVGVSGGTIIDDVASLVRFPRCLVLYRGSYRFTKSAGLPAQWPAAHG